MILKTHLKKTRDHHIFLQEISKKAQAPTDHKIYHLRI